MKKQIKSIFIKLKKKAIKYQELKPNINLATIFNYKKITFKKFNSTLEFIKIKNLKPIFKDKINLDTINPILLTRKLQDKLENLVASDINKVVLKQSRFWAQSITWILMGGTVFSVAWISVAKTDEIVIATGKLEPTGGIIDVQMPLEGVAREILVKEGEVVTKGQILIKLDTEITEAKNASLMNNLDFNKDIMEKLSFLFKEGAVSELQYLQQKAKVEDIKSELKANNVTLKYQKIVSPVDGIVFDLQPKSPGYVAKSSQPVMQIVPSKNLIAKVEIDSRTIGFVKQGKSADISIDSFPATDFGVIEGTVKSIGSDALAPIPAQGKGYRFPAKITLKNQYLELKSGKKLELQAGMSLTANIKLRKVTYLKLLLNKFSSKADSLKSI